MRYVPHMHAMATVPPLSHPAGHPYKRFPLLKFPIAKGNGTFSTKSRVTQSSIGRSHHSLRKQSKKEDSGRPRGQQVLQGHRKDSWEPKTFQRKNGHQPTGQGTSSPDVGQQAFSTSCCKDLEITSAATYSSH